MSDLEALMWRLGRRDPMFLGHMTLVGSLDRAVDAGRLEERVDALTRRIPRLRELVVPSRLGSLPPRWEPDPFFELGYHLRRIPVGGWGTSEDLLRAAEAVSVEDFDQDRPPWQVYIVEGLRDGRQGVIMRLHHSYTDGLGAVRLAGELFDLERHGSSRPLEAVPPREPAGSELSRVVGDMAAEASRSVAVMGRIGPWAVRALGRAVTTPDAQADGSRELIGSARRLLGLIAQPGSPILQRRSAGLHLETIDVDLDGMRRVARSVEGTINDVFLSGLLGGLGAYHRKHRSYHPAVRLAMPISTRSQGAGGPGGAVEMSNQLEAALLPGPLCIDDALERTRLVHEMVMHHRSDPGPRLFGELSSVAVRLPGATELIGRMTKLVDVVASNVPGPPVDLYLSGARVDSLVPFGPRGGAALNFTLISYRDRVHIGVNADPASIPDPALLVDCLRSGFAELLSPGA